MFIVITDLFSTPFEYNFIDQINPDKKIAFYSGKGYIFDSACNCFYSFNEEDISYEEDGYGYLKTSDRTYIVILGDRSSVLFNNLEKPRGYKDVLIVDTNVKPIISDITATSFFQEVINGNLIQYKSENLKHVVIDMGYHGEFWNINSKPFWGTFSSTYPWVEGVEGPGIGEEIDVEFNESYQNISIMNGYIDLSNRALYKANNRLKTIKIISNDDYDNFSIEYRFIDEVRFHTVYFPREVKKIKIKIIEVYPGYKYNDTAVSGIFSELDDQSLKEHHELGADEYNRLTSIFSQRE